MNPSQWGGVARALVMCAAAIAGTLGYLAGVDWASMATVAASAATGAAVLWSSWHSNSTEVMIEAVAKEPVVKEIQVKDPKLALSIPSDKVVKK